MPERVNEDRVRESDETLAENNRKVGEFQDALIKLRDAQSFGMTRAVEKLLGEQTWPPAGLEHMLIEVQHKNVHGTADGTPYFFQHTVPLTELTDDPDLGRYVSKEYADSRGHRMVRAISEKRDFDIDDLRPDPSALAGGLRELTRATAEEIPRLGFKYVTELKSYFKLEAYILTVFLYTMGLLPPGK